MNGMLLLLLWILFSNERVKREIEFKFYGFSFFQLSKYLCGAIQFFHLKIFSTIIKGKKYFLSFVRCFCIEEFVSTTMYNSDWLNHFLQFINLLLQNHIDLFPPLIFRNVKSSYFVSLTFVQSCCHTHKFGDMFQNFFYSQKIFVHYIFIWLSSCLSLIYDDMNMNIVC